MSQTETLMVLGLGAALMLVLVLLFGRVMWSWAMQGAARKQAKRVPVEMLELQADRDRLRAEHAVMARKLDLRISDIRVRMAEQMAEVSRNRNRVQTLLADLDLKEEALQNKIRENENLSSQLDTARAELDAAHRAIETLNTQSAKHDTDMSRLQSAFKKLNEKVADRGTAVDELSGELRTVLGPAAAAPVEDLSSATPAERLRRRTAEIASASAGMNRSSTSDQLANPVLTIVPSEEKPPAETANRLREKMDQAVQMNDDLQKEIRQIDELIGKTIAHDAKPQEEVAPVKRTGTVANVISLAQRIRALQKDLDE